MPEQTMGGTVDPQTARSHLTWYVRSLGQTACTASRFEKPAMRTGISMYTAATLHKLASAADGVSVTLINQADLSTKLTSV